MSSNVGDSMGFREFVGFLIIAEAVVGTILNTILISVFIFDWKTLRGQFNLIPIVSLTLGSLLYTSSLIAVIILCLSDGIEKYPTFSSVICSTPRIAYLSYMMGLLHIAFERLTKFYRLPLLSRFMKHSRFVILSIWSIAILFQIVAYCSGLNSIDPNTFAQSMKMEWMRIISAFVGLVLATAILIVYIFVIGRIIYIKRMASEQHLNRREMKLALQLFGVSSIAIMTPVLFNGLALLKLTSVSSAIISFTVIIINVSSNAFVMLTSNSSIRDGFMRMITRRPKSIVSSTQA